MLESWVESIPLMRQGYHKVVLNTVATMRKKATIYPTHDKIFNALELTPFDKAKVVLLGQDPYHGPGQAHGLSFSVPEGVKTPPSLRNVFKEIQSDIYDGQARNFSTDLTRWAKQGVLLLNAALTVEANKAGSHKNLGWHKLTDEVVKQLNRQRDHLVFMLWGRHAQAKKDFIDSSKHLILEAPHPSPLSANRGFFGCEHFSQANTYLEKHGLSPIEW